MTSPAIHRQGGRHHLTSDIMQTVLQERSGRRLVSMRVGAAAEPEESGMKCFASIMGPRSSSRGDAAEATTPLRFERRTRAGWIRSYVRLWSRFLDALRPSASTSSSRAA